MRVEVFGKDDCSRCESTKRKLTHFINKWGRSEEVDFVFVNLDTVDGMAEGAFHDVNEIPTTIVSHNGSTFARWDGDVPPSEEVKRVLVPS